MGISYCLYKLFSLTYGSMMFCYVYQLLYKAHLPLLNCNYQCFSERKKTNQIVNDQLNSKISFFKFYIYTQKDHCKKGRI